MPRWAKFVLVGVTACTVQMAYRCIERALENRPISAVMPPPGEVVQAHEPLNELINYECESDCHPAVYDGKDVIECHCHPKK